MAASPTPSIKSREIIGLEAFSRRRDVFGKHDTVFYPLSPICLTPTEFEKSTECGTNISRFRRTPAYSSMRETRREDIRNEIGFRERKMSDNFTSENQGDDVDYRHSLTERTRRISKLRREFLTSNLYETSNDPFTRSGTRATLPARSFSESHKIPVSNIYKFPFAEPYGTPSPTKKLIFDSSEVDRDTNDGFTTPKKHISLIDEKSGTPISLSELMKRYSPQPKPLNMTLPPTKPRVIAAVTKRESEDRDLDLIDKLEILETKLGTKESGYSDGEFENQSIENADLNKGTAYNSTNLTLNKDGKHINDILESDIVETRNSDGNCDYDTKNKPSYTNPSVSETLSNDSIIKINNKQDDLKPNGYSDDSSEDANERDDKVPEIPGIIRPDSRHRKKIVPDDNIPALLDKIEKNQPESTATNDNKKVKRKRSFLDKLLNRNKNKSKK